MNGLCIAFEVWKNNTDQIYHGKTPQTRLKVENIDLRKDRGTFGETDLRDLMKADHETIKAEEMENGKLRTKNV